MRSHVALVAFLVCPFATGVSQDSAPPRTLLRLFVANGVTTVVNLRGTPQILELRSAVASGRVFGPAIYTAGPFVNEPFVTTPDEVEQAVVAQKRAGYDFVKLHGNLSREAYARLNAVARREGIRVIGHAPRNLGVEAMFEERQYAVAHGEEFLYDRNNNSTDSSLPQVEARIPEFARSMVRAGIWLTPNVPGFSAHDELADLVAAGLTPFQALRAATANAADFLGPGAQQGVVAVGQNADLVLLDANPLENIANSRRIAGVVLRGRWLSRSDIERMLEGP